MPNPLPSLFAPEDGDQIYHLQVLLDAGNSNSAEVPNKLKTKALDVNLEKLKNGFGRVFACSIFFETEYHLTWLSESFTHYLIQYTGLIVKHQKFPIFTHSGFWDFIAYSPHNQELPKSVLLPPQAIHRLTDYDSNLNDLDP